MRRLATTYRGVPTVVSGAIGPRHDAYRVDRTPAPAEAARYHRDQLATLAAAGVDMVHAATLPEAPEAIGMVWAATEVDVPIAASFTVETDGLLPDGGRLLDAVEAVDRATDRAAAYFGVNCAHPEHLRRALAHGLTVLGGCCGTGPEHLRAIAATTLRPM